jgi:hypothetical protein
VLDHRLGDGHADSGDDRRRDPEGAGLIGEITGFADPSLFPLFGLPAAAGASPRNSSENASWLAGLLPPQPGG